jgi:hypothetical protein
VIRVPSGDRVDGHSSAVYQGHLAPAGGELQPAQLWMGALRIEDYWRLRGDHALRLRLSPHSTRPGECRALWLISLF